MEDMSNLIEEFSKIIEKDGIPDNFKEIINNINSEKKETKQDSNQDTSSFDFNNLDINTFLKLKKVMDKMNSKDNPNAQLLLALKPYLKKEKKEKLDQYIKLLNFTNIMDILKNDDGDKK